MTTTARVTIAVAHGVADVRLARPDKLNAFDPAMFDAVSDAIARIGAMREVRCVVLSGEGRAFSVGLDLATLGDASALRDLGARTHGIANRVQHVAWGWRALPQPVVAAVHGHAFGAGFQVMLGADIRLCAPDAELAMMEARWGLVPDMAGVALLKGLVRSDVAREIAFTARRMAGTEAAALGLVTRLANDPHAAALALAAEIAERGPAAVRAAKRLFNAAVDGDAAAILHAEATEQAALLVSADHRETLRAAAERRAPRFAD